MLVLHGFAFSNYYNIVKHALMLKDIPFEERRAYPGTEEILAVNAVGKVPALSRSDGPALKDSRVICAYLERAGAGLYRDGRGGPRKCPPAARAGHQGLD